MTISILKRVKVSSEHELSCWIGKQGDHNEPIMLVTYIKNSQEKYVSHAVVDTVLLEHGWFGGLRYTLNSNLIGYALSKLKQ